MVNLRKKKGISLIVLVITIIVMIILAATIILSLNSSGIISKANEAKTKSDKSTVEEYVSIIKAEWELEDMTTRENFEEYAMQKIAEAGYNGYEVTDSGKVYKYPVIPEGFVASIYKNENTVEDGLVIYKTTNLIPDTGIKITNRNNARKSYDQFVWIPVDGKKFMRKSFYKQPLSSSYNEPYKIDTYTVEETKYHKMIESVKKYGGFYIARYEAGDGNATEPRTTVTPAHKVVSRKFAQVYNNVPWGETMTNTEPFTISGVDDVAGAVYLSENMYGDNDSVVSHLVYGIEWDAVLTFVQDESHDMADSTGWGNYFDNIASNNPAKCGASEKWKAKNIYDIAGNVNEWTMECRNSNNRLLRGGDYLNNGNVMSAASRSIGDNTKHVSDSAGFRPALYIV